MPDFFYIDRRPHRFVARAPPRKSNGMIVKNVIDADSPLVLAQNYECAYCGKLAQNAPPRCIVVVRDRGMCANAWYSDNGSADKFRVASPQCEYKFSPSERFLRSYQASAQRGVKHYTRQVSSSATNVVVSDSIKNRRKADYYLLARIAYDETWMDQIIAQHREYRQVRYERTIKTDEEYARYQQREFLFNEPLPFIAARQKDCVELLMEHYKAQ